LPQGRLLKLFQMIHKALPWIKRISLYGNARAIRSKSIEQLRELKGNGLDRIYMGLESGCDDMLLKVKKGESGASMIGAAQQVRKAGIFLSTSVLLGLGGIVLSRRHAIDSAEVLRKMTPNQIAALTLMVVDNTPLGQERYEGRFTLPSSQQILAELYQLVSGLHGMRCQFHANHASNFLPIYGRLPKDHALLLQSIKNAMNGRTPLVPDGLRAL
ncbi:MAG: radical SAM protein, partial [Desulforhopalus sp.]